VTLLPKGAFAYYKAWKKAEGAMLTHLKPPHINPSEKMLALLSADGEVAPEEKVFTAKDKAAVSR
jgi:hypothetical protein